MVIAISIHCYVNVPALRSISHFYQHFFGRMWLAVTYGGIFSKLLDKIASKFSDSLFSNVHQHNLQKSKYCAIGTETLYYLYDLCVGYIINVDNCCAYTQFNWIGCRTMAYWYWRRNMLLKTGQTYVFASWNLTIWNLILNVLSISGENLSRLLYFYLPLCIVWAINVLFFALTVRRIIQLQYELKVMLKNESSRHQRKLNKDKEKYDA